MGRFPPNSELRLLLENAGCLSQGRGYGAFTRTLTLNGPLNAEEAEAVFEDGVLTLTSPNVKGIEPKIIQVNGR